VYFFSYPNQRFQISFLYWQNQHRNSCRDEASVKFEANLRQVAALDCGFRKFLSDTLFTESILIIAIYKHLPSWSPIIHPSVCWYQVNFVVLWLFNIYPVLHYVFSISRGLEKLAFELVINLKKSFPFAGEEFQNSWLKPISEFDSANGL